MDQLKQLWTGEEAYWLLSDALGGFLFYASLAYFLFEIARYILLKQMSWKWVGDSVANALTFLAYPIMSQILGATFFIALFFYAHEHWALADIPINVYTIVAAVVLADFVYYWEHRFMHRTGIGWLTHTVHHSSPEFNISVAYRFGPLDGFLPWFFHFPLVLIGFDPLLVFGAEIFVQAYQAILHTEAIPKLHRWVEKVFNTPSHHRVHHGSNPQYCDKNYGGIFIIWDRMFGTFEPEEEKVIYGISKPLNSVNPLVVFFHGFSRFWSRVRQARSVTDVFSYLFQPPEWTPSSAATHPAELAGKHT